MVISHQHDSAQRNDQTGDHAPECTANKPVHASPPANVPPEGLRRTLTGEPGFYSEEFFGAETGTSTGVPGVSPIRLLATNSRTRAFTFAVAASDVGDLPSGPGL